MRNQQQIDAQLDRLIKQAQRDTDRIFAKRLREILDRLAGIYRDIDDTGRTSRSNVTAYIRFQQELRVMNEAITQDYQQVLNMMQELLEDQYILGYLQRLYYAEYTAQETIMQTAPTLGVILRAVENPMENITLPKLMEKYRLATLQTIRDEVTQGLLGGESYSVMAQRIENAVGFARKKARAIARTEGGRVQMQAALDSFDEIERNTTLEWDKIWDATLDNRVRSAHRVLDGQKADDNGYFHYQGHQALAPHGFNVKRLDINCRCSVHFLPAGYQIEERRSKEEGIIPYTTYRKWFEQRTGQNFAQWYKETTGRELRD